MAKLKLSKNVGALLTILLMITALAACSEKDLYDSGDDDGQKPATDQYFGFETTIARSLYVNYGVPGYKALIEVYAENPIEFVNGNRIKKENVNALFKAYTDDNCTFDGDMPIPSDLNEVYLYTSYLGLPECVELSIIDGKASFDLPALQQESTEETKALTRATTSGSTSPYVVDETKAIYSLCKWSKYGKIHEKGYMAIDLTVNSNGEYIAALLNRLQAKIGKAGNKKDNTKYLSNESQTNISISQKAADGSDIKGATIDLVFLNERAGYQNTFGYYYYKTGTTPDIATLPKYIIFPNVSIGGDDPYNSYGNNSFNKAPLTLGCKVHLKFFGEGYDQAGSETFLPGYTIGWFLISNGFHDHKEVDVNKPIYYSNQSFNKGESRCMTLFDQKTQTIVIGFEDGDPGSHDSSYEDVLFYVDATPIKSIIDPESPNVPSIGDEEIVFPNITMTKNGTIAFEDLWPSQGDYDMNDLVLTYQSTITFDKDNKAIKTEDIFTPINNGAGVDNAFGYQLDGVSATNLKSVSIERPTWASTPSANIGMYDVELGQRYAVFRLFDSTKDGFTGKDRVYKGGNFKITIEYNRDDYNSVDKSKLVAPYNPFIMPTSASRKEVHLPKKSPTSLADMSLFGKYDDKSVPEKGLYYVSSTNYPFAIDIPTMEYKVPAERERIDVVYPKFNNWVATQGAEDADWYK
ncbi:MULTISPECIES: LruC domain-containing protein [unclassified Bacteroides]|uniref:LruC domain-containing protein n=1 Tax=unclassified Bacteroides TaxID=2646097 RepID=UPI000E84E083|nr:MULTISPECIES: LruC domain-containing protein [unclassified Bacteroides]RGN43380.1 LruC domain-containing protein [Bacteroides sp. OM05-12]RHR73786.1 LruC domain-containing protein [Bacteroides sp. AF16-49]